MFISDEITWFSYCPFSCCQPLEWQCPPHLETLLSTAPQSPFHWCSSHTEVCRSNVLTQPHTLNEPIHTHTYQIHGLKQRQLLLLSTTYIQNMSITCCNARYDSINHRKKPSLTRVQRPAPTVFSELWLMTGIWLQDKCVSIVEHPQCSLSCDSRLAFDSKINVFPSWNTHSVLWVVTHDWRLTPR